MIKKINYNWVLKTSDTSGGSYTDLCRMKVGKLPKMSRDVIPEHDILDEWERNVGGRKKLEPLTAVAHCTDANIDALVEHFATPPGGPNKFYQIVIPPKVGFTSKIYQFEGFLSELDSEDFDAESPRAIGLPFVIQPSGPLTIINETEVP